VERGGGVNTPCDVKILYDTEFEAEIAASKATHGLGAERIKLKQTGVDAENIISRGVRIVRCT
jgi:hypothetical protein